jgi:hypothetical protein
MGELISLAERRWSSDIGPLNEPTDAFVQSWLEDLDDALGMTIDDMTPCSVQAVHDVISVSIKLLEARLKPYADALARAEEQDTGV